MFKNSTFALFTTMKSVLRRDKCRAKANRDEPRSDLKNKTKKKHSNSFLEVWSSAVRPNEEPVWFRTEKQHPFFTLNL